MKRLSEVCEVTGVCLVLVACGVSVDDGEGGAASFGSPFSPGNQTTVTPGAEDDIEDGKGRISGSVEYLVLDEEASSCCDGEVKPSTTAIIRIYRDDGDGLLDPVSERCRSNCDGVGSDQMVGKAVGGSYRADLEPGRYFVIATDSERSQPRGLYVDYGNVEPVCEPLPLIELGEGDDIEQNLLLDAESRCE